MARQDSRGVIDRLVASFGQYHFYVESTPAGDVARWITPHLHKPGQVLPQGGGVEANLIVVKVPGGKVYIDRVTQTKYVPTTVRVFRVLQEKINRDGRREVVCDRVTDFILRPGGER